MEEPIYSFDKFQLLTGQRRLLSHGQDVRLGGRAMDILLTLIARAGEVVPTPEIVASVWPETHVEDGNLRVHMAALRKALGDETGEFPHIRNVTGRGYAFTAPLKHGLSEPARVEIVRPAGHLPPPATSIIGREQVLEVLRAKLTQRRCVTIVGPAGVGKTTVAVALANAVGTHFREGVVFVDLSIVVDPIAVTATIASAVGALPTSNDAIHGLRERLRQREMLIVLDNCEHVIEASAELVADILRYAPGVRVVATSREHLRVEDEWVQRLPPLDVPEEGAEISAELALQSSAVRLFVERCSANLGGYQLSDVDAPWVAEICRKLDGIALAIEFAAGLVGTIGLSGLTHSLNDFFRVFTRGRRTALSRHQTLRAAIEWSFNLIPEQERAALRSLSVFSGFTMDAAYEIAGEHFSSRYDFEDAISNLVAKSLISPDLKGRDARYRLLETTRAYARAELTKSDPENDLALRHARYFLAQLEGAAILGKELDRNELGNVREAVAWSFSPGGDPEIGIALVVAAVPLWISQSLVDECIATVSSALKWIGEKTGFERARMQLYAALGWPQMHKETELKTGAVAWQVVLDIADALEDREYQLRALWALWVDRTNSGRPKAALDMAMRFKEAASASNHSDFLLGDRMIARAYHLVGHHEKGQQHVEHMLLHYPASASATDLIRFQYDQRTTAQITLARILWVTGEIDRARECIADMIEMSSRHSLTLCHVMSDGACPISISIGDFAESRRYVTLLQERTKAHALDVWNTYASIYEVELKNAEGEAEAGLDRLSEAMALLRRSGFLLYDSTFVAALARALVAVGRIQEASDIVAAAITQCEATGEGWYLPELLRMRGDLHLQTGGSEALAAALFERSRNLARGQNARFWLLRTAISESKLAIAKGRVASVRQILQPSVEFFHTQHHTADYREAVRILQSV
ncbi:ATP-binding protein [Neorhizobium galegae]|uniref:ATP-binding protein n=1 Tax=Neorhizobium galegae TaxID=399 RepID=UPI001F408C94|nr:winged helix-turn-helix domain-containing protein [Neorhizobium galegae]UIK04790.1 winged helix-turn-helix domain-containing protein [Neorhizobium galegae]